MGSVSLLCHLVLSVFYTYSIYVYIYELVPPEELNLIRNANYGPFKYLTFWDLLMQWLWFTLAVLGGLTGGSQYRRGKPMLQRILDFLFTAILFPIALFVSVSFWTLFIIDREMIFPVIYDTFFPLWLNHAIHTLPTIAVVGELLCCMHTFPSQRTGFLTIAAAALTYLLWVCYIAYNTGHWVYPILAQLHTVGRAGFIAGCCMVTGIFYFIGYGLQALRWGHESRHEDLIYHKRK
uniref:Androgen-induced gene 1 protein-like n=1 Tax=Hirondellea gigas TaxID=1518452 RepID=A0A2P2I1V6_9CRUS